MGMFEVLMSALILAMVSVGVLKTFDAANANAGYGKSRAAAASLAQDDIERLRGYTAKRLSGMDETNPRTVNGVTYQVHSQTQWLSDSSGTRSCTSQTSRAEYLRLTSTVTWPAMRRDEEKVTQTSLYAPPNGSFGNQGSFGVKVSDRNGVGVPGVAISATGPQSLSGTTDSNGCVYFAYVTTGSYDVQFSKPGYVDEGGQNLIKRTVGVTAESTTIESLDYDRAGKANIRVLTRKGALAAPIDSFAKNLTIGHSQLPSPGTRVFGDGVLGQRSYVADNLFPFTTKYVAYAGGCLGANPSDFAGRAAATAAINPGATTNVDVYQPGVRIKLPSSWASSFGSTDPAGYAPKDMTVTLTATSPGCGGTSAFVTGSDGWIRPSAAVNDPGVPDNKYDICVGGVTGRKFAEWRFSQEVSDPNGVDVTPTGNPQTVKSPCA